MLFIGCYIVPGIYPLGTRKQKTPNNREFVLWVLKLFRCLFAKYLFSVCPNKNKPVSTVVCVTCMKTSVITVG